MKNHSMVSECSGDLFDTRKPDWYKNRHCALYGEIKRDCKYDNMALKAAIRAKYVWLVGMNYSAYATMVLHYAVIVCAENIIK